MNHLKRPVFLADVFLRISFYGYSLPESLSVSFPYPYIFHAFTCIRKASKKGRARNDHHLLHGLFIGKPYLSFFFFDRYASEQPPEHPVLP